MRRMTLSELRNILSVLAGLACLLASCAKDLGDCFQGAGSLTQEYRDLDPFSEIRLETNADLVLCPDTGCYVRVVCGSGLLRQIRTTVSDGRLTVRNENRCNWVRDLDPAITVYVHFRELTLIDYNAVGDIRCADTLLSDLFRLEVRDGGGSIRLLVSMGTAYFNAHEGAVDVTVNGRVGVQYLYCHGYGPIDASGVRAKFCHVRNAGTNRCRVWVDDELQARIDYVGDIYYQGNPATVTTWIFGEGEVIYGVP